MIPKDSGRKENWYIRFITLCMSNFNIPEEFNFDEKSGELKKDIETKHIKVSKTDGESGCFAYSHQTFCDKNGFVVLSLCVPGNVHDSVSFFPAYHLLNKKYK